MNVGLASGANEVATNAVVAICVVLVPAAAVKAVAAPVKFGVPAMVVTVAVVAVRVVTVPVVAVKVVTAAWESSRSP